MGPQAAQANPKTFGKPSPQLREKTSNRPFQRTVTDDNRLPLRHHPVETYTMASLTNASRACLRAAASRTPSTAARALSTTAVRPAGGDGATAWTSYSSPFAGGDKANNVPDFGKYASTNNPASNKLFQYFMVGSLGAITAAGAKSTVQGGFPLHLGLRGRQLGSSEGD